MRILLQMGGECWGEIGWERRSTGDGGLEMWRMVAVGFKERNEAWCFWLDGDAGEKE
jgi:hypothetical protein